MQELLLSVVYSPFLRQFTCCPAAVIGIGCCQPDTNTAFVNFKPQAALAVIIGQLA